MMSKILCTAALVSALALSGAAFAQGTSTMPAGSSTMAPAAPAATKTVKPMASRKPVRSTSGVEAAEEQATAQLNLRQIGQ